jgi:hypothetical protein
MSSKRYVRPIDLEKDISQDKMRCQIILQDLTVEVDSGALINSLIHKLILIWNKLEKKEMGNKYNEHSKNFESTPAVCCANSNPKISVTQTSTISMYSKCILHIIQKHQIILRDPLLLHFREKKKKKRGKKTLKLHHHRRRHCRLERIFLTF